MNWTYVHVVYENSNYGLKGYAELERAATLLKVCLATTQRIDFTEQAWGTKDYDHIIEKILSKPKATGKGPMLLQDAAYVLLIFTFAALYGA